VRPPAKSRSIETRVRRIEGIPLQEFARALMIAVAIAIEACGAGLSSPSVDGGPSFTDAGTSGRQPTVTTRIREDFDNQQLVDEASNVVIDYNRGLVTLPTFVFPEISSDRLTTYANDIDVNGTVQASDIVLDERAKLNASDSIQLLARNLLRVTGEIHAGAGGVTLAAGEQVIVDGTIVSEGPIKILLGDNTGTVAIAGIVNAISSAGRQPADLRIIARGTVTIAGQVFASGDMGEQAGDVEISAYGKVTVRGAGASIVSSARMNGKTGGVHIKSESAVEITDGAVVGGRDDSMMSLGSPPPPMTPPNAFGLAGAGDVEIQAPRITVGESASVIAASTFSGVGGSVLIVAGERLDTLVRSVIGSGSGDSSGSISIHSLVTNVGDYALIQAGTGASSVKAVSIESSGVMTMGRDSAIVGGIGGCAAGGDVIVHVAAELEIMPGGWIKGGAGGQLTTALGCGAVLHPGGNVEVIARSGIGTEGAISGGTGSRTGSVHEVFMEGFEVPPPMLEAGTEGLVDSRVIDRGEASVGIVPILVEAKYAAVVGTSVDIELGGGSSPDGPFEYLDLSTSPSGADGLSGSRYFKYRVRLHGRAFDTPIVDYFDIDLAPRGSR
jgi:hypothetical protein